MCVRTVEENTSDQLWFSYNKYGPDGLSADIGSFFGFNNQKS